MREVLVKTEEFKDSPVGKIPKDWEVKKLGELANNRGEYGSGAAALEFNSDLPRYVRITDITDDGNLDPNSRTSINRPNAEGYYLQKGDLLFARSGATVGKTYLYDEADGECAHAGYVIKFSLDSSVCEPCFVSQWTRSSFYWTWVKQTLRQGAQPNINAEEYKSVNLPYPPVNEQGRIAEILDTVDEAIARTSSLIIKLKQTKAGLLQDLLTRGLDEDSKLRDPQAHPEQFKDSPLVRIPKGWEAKPLAAIADLQVGFAFKSEWFQEHDGVKLLRGENVGYGVPDWSETRKLPWNMYLNYLEYELVTGNIIIGMDRTFTKSGVKISVLESSDVPALLVQRVGRFLPIECDQQFLRTLLSSQQYHYILLAQQKGMDIPHLSKSEILEPLVTVPPIEEQIRIAAIIDTHATRIRKEEAYLNKLKLQKQGVMQDLLTGKVRVSTIK